MLQFDIDKMEDYMSAKEMSYQDLAAKSGVSLKTLSRLREAPENFTSKTVNRIANAFKANATEFMIEGPKEE